MFICFLCIGRESYGTDKFYYVDPELISPEFIAPPNLDKKFQQKEARQILEYQTKITKAELAGAQKENIMKSEDIADIPGLNATREDYPETYILLDNVKNDCSQAVQKTKNYWNTERPYLANKNIKLLVDSPAKNGAYPSGHTACSRVWAEVLGQVKPELLAEFRAKAREIAHHRVIIGMHWPQDLVGGEQLALIFFGALQASESYRNDVTEAQKEWK